MKRYQFPAQVKYRTVRSNADSGMSTPPPRLHVSVRQPEVRGNAVVAEAELVNDGEESVLVVNPYGGAFPYGGTNPFRIAFASSGVVKYSDRLYPPCPPLPMAITIPASSVLVFTAIIDLENYTWEGTPKAEIDWAFYYAKGSYPEGKFQILLPRKN